MVKHKWLLSTVRTLFDIKLQMDSAAAINGAEMSSSERVYIQNKIQEILDFIKKNLP